MLELEGEKPGMFSSLFSAAKKKSDFEEETGPLFE